MAGDRERRNLADQLRDAARVVRAQLWLIALCVVASVAAVAIYNSLQETSYSSTAKLLLQQADPNAAVLQGGTLFPDPARERATDLELVEQRPVAERVVDRLGLDSSVGQVLAKISTDVQGDSNVLSITATDLSPKKTAALANAFAQEFVEFQRDTQERRYREALTLVQARIQQIPSDPGREAELERLRGQAKELRLLTELQTGDAQVIERAIGPGAPVAADGPRQLLLAGVLGMLVGLGLAFLRDRLDTRLKTEEEVREALPDVPIIGSIPKITRNALSRDAAAESFRLLQSDIEFLTRHQGDLRFLLVTSALPAEGKSSTSANLALAMAQCGTTVTLLEADLRNPELSRRWAIEGAGTADILRGDTTLDRVVRTTSISPDDERRGPSLVLGGEIQFVPAGSANGDYTQLLKGGSFPDLMMQLSQSAGAAVIDGPPLGMFSDVAPLARLADGVILVVRLGHSQAPALRRLSDRLARASVKPIGIVVVGAPSPSVREYGSYYTH